jgi:hypothetical protein
MALTKLKSHQLNEKIILPSLVAANLVEISSNNGSITVPNTSNFFIVDGNEQIVEIKGLSYGRVMIQWKQDRSLKFTLGKMEFQTNVDRNVKAGDISEFVFYGENYVREISFSPKNPEEQSIFTIEEIATQNQTEIMLPLSPKENAQIIVTVNGVTNLSSSYGIIGNKLVFVDPLLVGDEVKIVLIDKVTVIAGGGSESSNWIDIVNKPTTIVGYGITDTYSKVEIDTLVGDIENALKLINGGVI